jgi:hypothetical protein
LGPSPTSRNAKRKLGREPSSSAEQAEGDPSDAAGILVVVWPYVILAVGALLALRVVARIVFATERVAVDRAARQENRELRERLRRYTAR